MKKILLLYLLLVFASCEREAIIIESEPTPVINIPEDLVSGSVIGVIQDEAGLIEGAEVIYKSHVVFTDELGQFAFTDIEVDENGTYIKVRKSGYFEGSRTFYPVENETSQVKIQLLPRTVLTSIQSANGGRVNVGQAYIDLPSGSYKGMDRIHDGNIEVFGQWLDPSLESTYYAMPGNQRGVSDAGELRVLASFGMLKVDLEDSDAERLELPEEEMAVINLPIPTSLLDFAPMTIPLWYFDETNGLWIQQGTAERTNDNYYTAEINHFSFWNCNVAFEGVELSALVHLDGQPVMNRQMKIIDKSTGYQAFGYTSASGRFTAKVPKGQALELHIESNCFKGYIEHNLAALSSNTDWSESPIELVSDSGDIEVTGKVSNCDNSLPFIGKARVLIDDENYLVKTNAEGFFTLDLNSCSGSDLHFFGIDLEHSMISAKYTAQAQSHVDVANLEACKAVPTAHDINYPNMDWQTILNDNADHLWVVRTITGSNELVIINTSVSADNVTYMSGAFSYKEGKDEASYLLKFETQGFTVSGTCHIETIEHDDFKSYRFFGNGTEIDVVNEALFPGDIDFVNFDLVYYD